MIDGFQGVDRGPRPRAALATCSPSATGQANPLPSDAAMMDSLVWVPRRRAPHWATGGTYGASG